ASNGGYHSWVRHILPDVESQNATWERTLKVLTCPSDPRAGGFVNPVDLHAYTSYLAVCGTDNYGSDGVMYLDSRVSLTKIPDGTSTRLAAVERPPLMMGNNWGWGWWESWDVGDVSLGLSTTTMLGQTGPCPTPQRFGPGAHSADTNGYIGDTSGTVPNSPNCHGNHPGSFHTGRANLMFADGSVRFVPYTAGSVLPAFATRAGREAVDHSQL